MRAKTMNSISQIHQHNARPTLFNQKLFLADQQTAPVEQRHDHTSRGEDNQRDNTSIPQIEQLSNPSNADANQNSSCRGDQDTRPCVVSIGDSIIKNITPQKLSRKRVHKFTYPGKSVDEIESESAT